MFKKLCVVAVRIAGVLCVVSLAANLMGLYSPKGWNVVMSIAFIALWLQSEYSWKKKT
ncbi:TPA: hypothetical protein OPR08_000043 [Citrobacter koseri]|uniref:hypothetical protein n=1 Tax=Citrobacter koseri TaxID=545 RepID=UPI00397D1C86|nr:hypothetical protein [Citrobacter koseri]